MLLVASSRRIETSGLVVLMSWCGGRLVPGGLLSPDAWTAVVHHVHRVVVDLVVWGGYLAPT